MVNAIRGLQLVVETVGTCLVMKHAVDLQNWTMQASLKINSYINTNSIYQINSILKLVAYVLRKMTISRKSWTLWSFFTAYSDEWQVLKLLNRYIYIIPIYKTLSSTLSTTINRLFLFHFSNVRVKSDKTIVNWLLYALAIY